MNISKNRLTSSPRQHIFDQSQTSFPHHRIVTFHAKVQVVCAIGQWSPSVAAALLTSSHTWLRPRRCRAMYPTDCWLELRQTLYVCIERSRSRCAWLIGLLRLQTQQILCLGNRKTTCFWSFQGKKQSIEAGETAYWERWVEKRHLLGMLWLEIAY